MRRRTFLGALLAAVGVTLAPKYRAAHVTTINATIDAAAGRYVRFHLKNGTVKLQESDDPAGPWRPARGASLVEWR